MEAITRKRQRGSDNVEATTWKRQRVTLFGYRTSLSSGRLGPVVQSPIGTNPGLTLNKAYGVNPGLALIGL